ncbi:MAG: ROK family protein [Planctomycetota bacterium]
MQNAQAIGIDIGGTKIVGAVVDADGTIGRRIQVQTEAHKGGDAVLQKLVDIVTGLRTPAIVGVGIGTPGPVDTKHGVVKQVVNIAGWQDTPVARLMQERINLPTWLGNDGNVAALAEYWKGAGRGKKVVVVLTLGTGVGSGVVIDGAIMDGATGWAAELGHVSIAFDGRKCACGKTGCIEAYASANATFKRYVEKLGSRTDTLVMQKAGGDAGRIDAKMVCDAAREGEPLASEVVGETGFYLGVFCGSLINALNPDVILLGGGMSAAGDILFDRVREVAGRESLRDPFAATAILPAALGNDAGLVGAAALVHLAQR